MLPARVGLDGTTTQLWTRSEIQPLDCGPPATADGLIALTIVCTRMPNTTVAPRIAPSRAQGRILTTIVARIRP